ncbi:MAG: hypothetical protein K2O89_02265 [Clostridia bacterium]|nr:hypothetical protein [Clostridia bacterium]
MIPILFKADATDFSTFGIGALTETLTCEVTEERNGTFECKLTYPSSGRLYAEILKDRIIKAKPNDTNEAQAFRIYKISLPINGTITIYAQHISYDLSGIGILPFEKLATSPQLAMDYILQHATSPHNFTFQTDYSVAKDFSVLKPKSIRACLGGEEGSVLNLWGGEFEWDNFDIKHHQGRGEHTDVVIEYGKNLTKFTHESEDSGVYTEVLPFAFMENEDDGETLITLPEITVPIENSQLLHKKTLFLDLTDSFDDGTLITESMLRNKVEAYIKGHSLDVAVPTITVSFEPLWQMPEYAAVLERLSLCDTVTIKHSVLGVTAKAKVIKTVYNTLAEKYTSVTLGSAKANLMNTIEQSTEELEKVIDKANASANRVPMLINSAIRKATDKITGETGGYVVMHTHTDTGQPYELLILDAPTIEEAVNVWRWNVNGLGFSSKGYNGPYETAITADGRIVADFITSGTLVANIIKAGTISSVDGSSFWNLDTGEVVLKAYATTETVERVETAANQAQSSANQAQSSADKAQTTANQAQNAVDDLASDVSVLSGNVGTLTTSVKTLTTKQATLESNVDGLTSKVTSITTRVTTAEGKLVSVESAVSTLKQTTTEISAEVSKKVDETYGSSSSSFGWVLKSTGFYVYSSASTVMSITSSGLSVVGAIDATSGSIGNLTIDGYLYFGGNSSYYISANYNDSNYYINLPGLRIDKASTAVFSGKLSAPSGTIGGFTISTASIYKTKTSYSSTTAGVYIGTDGIGLGAGTFYVTSAGKLYATDAEISGTITATSGTIGGFTINASSLTNASGGSSIQITSGNYKTYLGANTVYSTYSLTAGARGWSLSHSAISISAYASSVYSGIKIMPTYTKRTSTSVYTSTTVAEGCITAYASPSYNVDQGYTTGSAVPFIIGLSRQYAKSPYTPSNEWGAYLRFVNYQLAELVYDSYYSGVWRMRDVTTGRTYDLTGHKFYFWTYSSSCSDDAVYTCTQTTHGLTTIKGAVVMPRSTATSASSLSGYTNVTNKGYQSVGVTISGTTVYVTFDYGTYQHGFFCLIYGS